MNHGYNKILFYFLLATLTLTCYLPAMRHGNFVMDDDDYIRNNPQIKQADGLLGIWFRPSESPQYYPAVFTMFFFENRVFGDYPRGYIIINVLLHAANACLIFLLLGKLKIPGAWLAAAVFALHPMNVESVAWIAERKNTLGLLFSLAAILFLIVPLLKEKSSRRKQVIAYLVSSLCVIAALLSKSAAVVVAPATLLLLLWLKRKINVPRINWFIIAGWFAISIADGLLITHLEYHYSGAKADFLDFTVIQRLMIAGQSWWFYPLKFFWPHPISFIYPRWPIENQDHQVLLYAFCAVALAILLWLFRRRIGYAPLLVILVYSAAIGPMLGFLSIGYFHLSFVADHFAYWALVPLCAGFAALAATAIHRWPRLRWGIGTVCALIVITLSAISWDHGYVYKSWTALFNDALKKNPESVSVWTAYGQGLLKEGRYVEGRDAFLKVVNNSAFLPEDYGAIAYACIQLGYYDQAQEYTQKFLTTRPYDAYAHHINGILLSRQGRQAEAVTAFLHAYELKPTITRSIFNAALVLVQMRQFDKAIECYKITLNINPRSAQTHNLMGRALAATGRLPDAIVHFRRACELDNNPEYQADLSRAMQIMSQQQSSSSVLPPATRPQ